MFKKILVATDGSELSHKAIDTAVQLAKSVGAAVVGMTAVEGYPYAAVGEFSPAAYNDFQARAAAMANDRLAAVERAVRAAGLVYDSRMVESTVPYRAIIDAARDAGCDLIVMASHGRRGLGGVLLGSETQRVLTHAECPVLVVR
jgi:nucleotide-binding universal stress UspA family protein